VEYRRDEVFGFLVPKVCPDISSEILDPSQTWDDKGAYRTKKEELARRFQENFQKYHGQVDPQIVEGGPRV